jgi:hypothetical protein
MMMSKPMSLTFDLLLPADMSARPFEEASTP